MLSVMRDGLFVAIIISTLLYLADAAKECPDGWKTKAELSSCYKGYVAKKSGNVTGLTWTAAEAFCRNFRTGHLASITTEAEQTFADEEVQPEFSSGIQFWIGLHQAANTSSWKWSDNSTAGFTNFHPELDHSTANEDTCVTLESMTGQWSQQSCLQSHGWMCEIQKGGWLDSDVLEEFPTAAPVNTSCGTSSDAGSWFYEHSSEECQYFSHQPGDSWSGARADCRSLNAHLVTVRNREQQNWITTKSSQLAGDEPDLYWIGLYQKDYAGREYAWDDGQVSMFRGWEQGQPSPHGLERCVAHSSMSGKWRDTNCGQNLRYICSKRPGNQQIAQITEQVVSGGCPEPWISHGQKCYYFSQETDQNATWIEAHKTCTGKSLPNSQLLSLHRAVDNSFVLSHMRSRQELGDFWMGLHELADSDDYGWGDNSQVDYVNWYFNEPSYLNVDKSCVVYRSTKKGAGKWKAVPCDSLRRYICQADKDSLLPYPTVAPSTRCPSEYIEYGDNCYRVLSHPENGGWTREEAQNACQNDQTKPAGLAVISDVFDNAFVHALLAEHWANSTGDRSAWIGLRKQDDHFVWRDTQCPVVFSNLVDIAAKPGEGKCVQMTENGGWIQSNCEQKAQFAVCQHRLAPCPTIHEATPFDYCAANFSSECRDSCFHVEAALSHHETDGQFQLSYLTFQEASTKCTELGGNLAVIANSEEQTCLQHHIQAAVYNLFIGLYESVDSDGKNSWQWVDNRDTGGVFDNWKTGEPFNRTDDNRIPACGFLQPDGKWVAGNCETHNVGYVCQAKKERRNTPRWTSTVTPLAPLDVFSADDHDAPLTGGEIAGMIIPAAGLLTFLAVLVFFTTRRERRAALRKAASRRRSGQENGGLEEDRQQIRHDENFVGESFI